MKKTVGMFFFLAALTSTVAFADVEFSGQPAMDVFNSLTGPKVVSDGAAGRTYLTGESLVCAGPNDPDAARIPENYFCTLRFNSNGKILPPAH